MADRFWVGGTANWDGTAGTKWATTSGGTGGASVPTTADDVFFTNLSTGTCTIATGNTGAKSINCTGFAGTIDGTAAITVAGGITLAAGMTYTHSGTITVTGTGTVTSAGKTIGPLTIDGTGITVTLGDALNVGGNTLTVTRGTFNSAGFNITAGLLSSVSGAGVPRTINLSSSTVTLSAAVCVNFIGASSSDLTLSGTYQINATASGIELRPGTGLTFYNVAFTTSATTSAITTSTTFNNLTINTSATGVTQLQLNANQTVNGTFTCAGSSAIARGFVRSITVGSTITLTAAAISANDCDFRDITLAGAAAGASPTRAGDCGGNSGITFPAAKTVYRVGPDNSSWTGSSSWALTSNGSGSNNNYPLAQDTAIIDNATTASSTSVGEFANIGSIDLSTRTVAYTLSHANATTIYGNYTLGSGVTVSGTNTTTFSGRGTQTLTSAGKTTSFQLTVNKFLSAFELGDAYSSTNSVILTRGTFDAKNYNLTCTTFSSDNSNTRTLTMGSGLWTLSGTGSVWNPGTISLTFNKDSANILLSNTTTTARSFDGASRTYNKLTIGGATGVSTLTITGTNTFSELASTKTVAHTIVFPNVTTTVGAWTISGSSGNVVTLQRTGVSGTWTIAKSTGGFVDATFLSISNSAATPADTWYAGTNSTDGGGNTGWLFVAAPPRGVALATGLTIGNGIAFTV
jgi:hypothetical protein